MTIIFVTCLCSYAYGRINLSFLIVIIIIKVFDIPDVAQCFIWHVDC